MKRAKKKSIRAIHFLPADSGETIRWRVGEDGVKKILKTIHETANDFSIQYQIIKQGDPATAIIISEEYHWVAPQEEDK